MNLGIDQAREHPVLPEWITFRDPADAHPAAFEAYVHREGCAVLYRIWHATTASGHAGSGSWRWRLTYGGRMYNLRITGVDHVTPDIFEEANHIHKMADTSE
jgi:hypothetical protein